MGMHNNVARRLGSMLTVALFVFSAVDICGAMQASTATNTASAPSAPNQPGPAASAALPNAPSNAAADMQAVAQVSAAAIKSSQDAVDQVKWVFSVASIVVTGLLGVLAFLGFQNMRSVAESVREEARRRVDEEIAAAQKIISLATQVVVRTAAALRLVSLAEKWAETTGNQRSCFKRAITAIRDVRSAADGLKDETTQAWTHSFEAFCLRGLNDYEGAIASQLTALNLSDTEDPLDRYNAACYYALVGHAQSAAAQLSICIGSGGEQFKALAKNDSDFDLVKHSPEIVQIIGAPTPIDPSESPDKTAPTIPPEGRK